MLPSTRVEASKRAPRRRATRAATTADCIAKQVEDGRSPEHVAAYEAVARLLWAHSEQGLVRGSREVELKTMAKGEDALGRATVELHSDSVGTMASTTKRFDVDARREFLVRL